MLEFIGGEVPQICYVTVGMGSKVIVTDSLQRGGPDGFKNIKSSVT